MAEALVKPFSWLMLTNTVKFNNNRSFFADILGGIAIENYPNREVRLDETRMLAPYIRMSMVQALLSMADLF